MVRLFQSRGIFAVVARLRLATFPVDACRACDGEWVSEAGPGRVHPGPWCGGGERSAEWHFRDEEVVPRRAGAHHVGVEDHHLAVGARFPERHGPVLTGRVGRVVVQEQPRVAAVAAHEADGQSPQRPRPGANVGKAAQAGPLFQEVSPQLGIRLDPVPGVVHVRAATVTHHLRPVHGEPPTDIVAIFGEGGGRVGIHADPVAPQVGIVEERRRDGLRRAEGVGGQIHSLTVVWAFSRIAYRPSRSNRGSIRPEPKPVASVYVKYCPVWALKAKRTWLLTTMPTNQVSLLSCCSHPQAVCPKFTGKNPVFSSAIVAVLNRTSCEPEMMYRIRSCPATLANDAPRSRFGWTGSLR